MFPFATASYCPSSANLRREINPGQEGDRQDVVSVRFYKDGEEERYRWHSAFSVRRRRGHDEQQEK